MAAASGKVLTMDMRVCPPPISAMVTRTSLMGMSELGVPSASAKPSRKTSRCGGSASTISQ